MLIARSLSAKLWGRLMLGHTKESEVLSPAWSWNRGKRGRSIHFEPHRLVEDISGVLKQEDDKGRLGAPKWRGFEEKDWEVSVFGWDVVRDRMPTANTNLRMAWRHLAPSTTIFGPWTHNISMTFTLGKQFLWYYPKLSWKKDFYSCLTFLSQGLNNEICKKSIESEKLTRSTDFH